jgi:hypothetical protein
MVVRHRARADRRCSPRRELHDPPGRQQGIRGGRRPAQLGRSAVVHLIQFQARILRPPSREEPHADAPGSGDGAARAETKISVPELPADLVHRPALGRELDRAVDVVLLCAPAGYGKTTLLADWVNASSDADTAWVRVDRDDDDPRRLWSAGAGSRGAVPVGAGVEPAADRAGRCRVGSFRRGQSGVSPDPEI